MNEKQLIAELKKHGLTDADLKGLTRDQLQSKLDEIMLSGNDSVLDDDFDDEAGASGVNNSGASLQRSESGSSGDDEFTPDVISAVSRASFRGDAKDPCKVRGYWLKTGDLIRLNDGESAELGPKTYDWLKDQKLVK